MLPSAAGATFPSRTARVAPCAIRSPRKKTETGKNLASFSCEARQTPVRRRAMTAMKVMSMTVRKLVNGLSIAKALYDFIEIEALPGTGVTSDRFWRGLSGLIREFRPRNQHLLAVRDELQTLIDDYHRANRNKPWDQSGYERFLRKIGYVLPEPA